jgi:uncharacterized membrane protein
MLLILAFEGVVAGTLGMLAFYTAIRQGELSRVVPLAFTPPFGVSSWASFCMGRR